MLATAFKGLSVTSSSALLGGRPCQAGTTHRPLPLQRNSVCPSIEAAHKKGAGSSKNGRYGARARKVSARSLTLFCYSAEHKSYALWQNKVRLIERPERLVGCACDETVPLMRHCGKAAASDLHMRFPAETPTHRGEGASPMVDSPSRLVQSSIDS